MSRVVYYAAMSLDGYIAEDDDTLDWLNSYDGSYEGNGAPPVEGGYDEFYESVGAIVMGSVTYEWVLGYMKSTGRSWMYPGMPSWILSSRDLPVPEGADVRIVDASAAEIHDGMVAAAAGKNVWVVGGGNVASQFADAALLDEVRATVVPVVLGQGKPLFDRRIDGGPMQLTGVYPRKNGMVELTYRLES
jgi:dihydrofolate reductase